MATRLKRGDFVTLPHDLTTRGGTRFKAGLTMQVTYVAENGEVNLGVWKLGRSLSIFGVKQRKVTFLRRPTTEEALNVPDW